MKSISLPPTTRLEDYIEYRKEINAEVNLASARCAADFDQDGVYRNLKKRIDQIYESYRDLLSGDDVYVFKELNELEKFLLSISELDQTMIPEAIQHEKAHAEKANELGYDVKGFSCVLMVDKNRKITYATVTHIQSEGIIPSEDLRNMALAPENPSYSDKYH